MARRRRARKTRADIPVSGTSAASETLSGAVRFQRSWLRPYPLLLGGIASLAVLGVIALLVERELRPESTTWVDPSRVGPERTLSLTADVVRDVAGDTIRIAGQTNLPDGVSLEVTATVLREVCIRERAVVRDGAFELLVPAAGKIIEPGTYDVAATFDLYAQAEETREELHYQPRRLVQGTTLTVTGDATATEAFVREQLQLLHALFAGPVQNRAVALAEVRTARGLIQARRETLLVSRLTPALADLERLAEQLEAHLAAEQPAPTEIATRRRQIEELIARVHVEARL